MDRWISRLLLLAACSSTAVLAAIALFIFKEGVPIMARSGMGHFLFGNTWAPLEGQFGILPFIVGSLIVTAGALTLGVPLGVACAVYLAGSGPATLEFELTPGSYTVEWINTRTGEAAGRETIQHQGGKESLTSPSFEGDIAMRLKRVADGTTD